MSSNFHLSRPLRSSLRRQESISSKEVIRFSFFLKSFSRAHVHRAKNLLTQNQQRVSPLMTRIVSVPLQIFPVCNFFKDMLNMTRKIAKNWKFHLNTEKISTAQENISCPFCVRTSFAPCAWALRKDFKKNENQITLSNSFPCVNWLLSLKQSTFEKSLFLSFFRHCLQSLIRFSLTRLTHEKGGGPKKALRALPYLQSFSRKKTGEIVNWYWENQFYFSCASLPHQNHTLRQLGALW